MIGWYPEGTQNVPQQEYSRGLGNLKYNIAIGSNESMASSLKEQKISVPFYAGELPGATEAIRKDLTEKTNKFFENFSISPNSSVQDVTSGAASGELTGKDLASYDVKGWKYSLILNKWELSN